MEVELAYLLDRSSPCSHSFLSPAFVLLWAIKTQPDSPHGPSPYQTHWKNYKENVSKWKELGSSLERLRQVNLHKHQDHINMSNFYQRYGHHYNFPCSLFLKSTLASLRCSKNWKAKQQFFQRKLKGRNVLCVYTKHTYFAPEIESKQRALW